MCGLNEGTLKSSAANESRARNALTLALIRDPNGRRAHVSLGRCHLPVARPAFPASELAMALRRLGAHALSHVVLTARQRSRCWRLVLPGGLSPSPNGKLLFPANPATPPLILDEPARPHAARGAQCRNGGTAPAATELVAGRAVVENTFVLLVRVCTSARTGWVNALLLS